MPGTAGEVSEDSKVENKRNARRAAKRAELREERRSTTTVVFWVRDDCRLSDNAGLAAAAAKGAVVPVSPRRGA